MAVRKKLILLSLLLGCLVEQPTPEVTIQQGTLRGRISADGQIFEYLGIPYSTANETNRYKAPFPPPAWDGVFEAVNEHYRCPQKSMIVNKVIIGEEDCLKINVYTPAHVTKSGTLPVMVYIHGGSFVEGSANKLIYDPANFVRRGVIVASFNYRLGALGFLCLGLEGAPGNAGLKDQLAALRWVKNNIRAFGGDPDDVTLFGESAGAASVSNLRLARNSKGLFKRIIMQSGSSLPVWAISGDPIGVASRFAEYLGYYTTDPEELLEIYKNVPTKSLVGVKTPKKEGSIVSSNNWFIPCIEKEIEGVERIIEEPPHERLLSGNYNHVPTITGFNDREGIFLIAGENETTLREKDRMHNLASDIRFDINRDELEKRLRKIYFDDKPISTETVLNLADVYGDQYFIMPIIFEAEMVSKISKEVQYNYIFKYSGIRNIIKYWCGFPLEPGAVHADEIFYMFRTNLHPYTIVKSDAVMIERLTTMWTNFAKYSNPTPSKSELLPVQWAPSDSTGLNFFTIDKELSINSLNSDELFQERFNFWNETYTKYRRQLYKVGLNTPQEFYWM